MSRNAPLDMQQAVVSNLIFFIECHHFFGAGAESDLPDINTEGSKFLEYIIQFLYVALIVKVFIAIDPRMINPAFVVNYRHNALPLLIINLMKWFVTNALCG
jgi:hypothetical protein